MYFFDLTLWIMSLVLPTLVCFGIFRFARAEMQKMLGRKQMKRWEVGLFSGWLAGGPLAYFVYSVYSGITHSVGYSVPSALFFAYAFSLYVCGPVGALAAFEPWSLIGRKRLPKVLGCGNHGLPNSRLAGFDPNTCLNNSRDYQARNCSHELYRSRQKTMLTVMRPKMAPPPLMSADVLEPVPDETTRIKCAHVEKA